MAKRLTARSRRPASARRAALLGCLLGLLVTGPTSEASGDCSDLALPPLLVTDLDSDGRYTGQDIGLALQTCADLGGCTLTLLDETYDDVAIFLHESDNAWDCTPERSVCSMDAFPDGLVIQGQGAGTVLRSPLWSPPYAPKPILEMRRRHDVRFQLRDLTLDGRKAEQLAPSPGQNDQLAWLHHGFQSWNQWTDHDRPSRGGCIQGVTIRSLLKSGISLNDAAGWTIENSTVEDVGCQRGFTDCPNLGLPDVFGSPPGYQAAGYGILAGWYVEDLLVRNNTVRRTTKYAIGLKHGQDGLETSINRPRVVGNRMLDVGYLGIFLAGVENGSFLDNKIDSTNVHDEPREWASSYNTFAVECLGLVENTTFSRNEILDSAGISINYQCSGEGNRIADTRIERSCREKHPEHCTDQGDCYLYPDLHVTSPNGSLVLEDVEILDTGCAAPLGVAADSEVELTIYGLTTQPAMPPSCMRLDLSRDGKVDQRDWQVFQTRLRTCRQGRLTGVDCDQVDLDDNRSFDNADRKLFRSPFQECTQG